MRLYVCAAVLTPLVFAGCSNAPKEADIAKYEQASCTQLARALGRHEGWKDQAEDDSLYEVTDAVLGDDDALYDSILSDIEASESGEHIEVLKRIMAEKKCPA